MINKHHLLKFLQCHSVMVHPCSPVVTALGWASDRTGVLQIPTWLSVYIRYLIGQICWVDKMGSPVSSLSVIYNNSSLGVLCKLLLEPMQEGRWAGRARHAYWCPAVGHAALYRPAKSQSADNTDAV